MNYSNINPHSTKIVIVGLGNPILGDDALGWEVVKSYEIQFDSIAIPDHFIVDFLYLSTGGLSLMENLIGYDHAILVDALNDSSRPVGTIVTGKLEDYKSQNSSSINSAHDTTLLDAIGLGHEIGANIPNEIHVIGVTARKLYDFSEYLSPEIKLVIPQALDEIGNYLTKLNFMEN